MKFSMTALVAAATLSACAQYPDSIEPVSMGNAYAGVTCEQAAYDLNVSRQKLELLSAQQTGAAIGDTIGLLIFPIPGSAIIGGTKDGEIAAEKGKILALEARLRSC